MAKDPVAAIEHLIADLQRQQKQLLPKKNTERYWKLHDEIVELDKEARRITASMREELRK